MVNKELRAKLEIAVAYIVKKCADETEYGSYYVHADDIPDDVLPPEMFAEHIGAIADMMLSYDAVAEADVEDGAISVIMYSDYCPGYEASSGELDRADAA